MTTMKYRFHISKRVATVSVTTAAIIVATGLLELGRSRGQSANANTPQSGAIASSSPSEAALDLTPSQVNSIKVEPVGSYLFPVEKEAVGNIDFDEDLSVQVFPAYQGTILKTFGELGARVQKDQPLYTIKSPDLIQAESNLIGAAATLDLTNKELARVQGLGGVSEREKEQATSDQQTAEGALKAARDAVLVFGKINAEIDQMIALRKIDPALVVRSPIAGKITYKVAQPGFLVQPGNVPAPYSVADVAIKWMLANVSEGELSSFHLGQPVQVKVLSYPGHVFKGKVSKIYETVDPNTHRATIRSEIADPKDELRPGMLANFVIRVDGPVEATAIPVNGVVREADGTMTAWVTTDRHHFEQKIIKIGLRNDDRVQVLEGLRRGELVVADGAVFLSNMLSAPPSD
ncbi:MAG: efflux RND transporter periplasmic adaptor subunit [Candidatus Sulfotelmatobacter sp.]|jgi:cobalt-zinc-cadmium efflux system membrane fusion protein